ncbi:Uncharacterized beta-barrel protein YwiB, DUF1934 family [Pseudobutyrivibrio sp. YE44]|uniref:DUF1934 domain-containing protein n=1 Tax=Pseudobutyrivibrio sp. YE44 TaxID=1520802 RepID=UPI00088B52B5|nr:DUF1934 domain-containing protein [Pseudobutyrivibrio sp. YE44]SDB23473.1 Uncharacterized beta-barrel protein YwiB, DUF1934 family [Pseudobutyrivibrio sp. YE44]
MAGQKCVIYLRSTQKMGGEQESTEEQYAGVLMDREDKRYISYKRVTEDGDIDCLISFDRRSLSMSQKGALRSKLELFPGKKTVNAYSTPVGTLDLEVFTKRYDVMQQSTSIKILIDYDILAGGEPIKTSMEIDVAY